MNILVLCDDYYHPALTVRQGLAGLASLGYEFDFIEDARLWSSQGLADYPAVILSKSNNYSSTNQEAWMTGAVQDAFVDYVSRGNGLLVIHSGTAGYTETLELRRLMGGVFLRHPEQCPVTYTPKPGHPLTARSLPFTHRDEHYFMAVDDEQVDILLTASSEHGDQPAGWTRSEGQGRVCVLTPGHNLPVWQDSSFQTLIDNALRWVSKDGVLTVP